MTWLASLGFVAGLLLAGSAPAAYKGLDGTALLRMCQGAEKVRALSVMCHNYLNGYLDAAHHFSARPGFCLADGDKEKLPVGLVEWLKQHADRQKLPAGQALDQALKDLYPCKGRK
ncbi:MAG: Rap1a/Tai family immunity protein [Pseudomonadota bacterium]